MSNHRRHLVQTYFDHMTAGNIDAIVAMFTPDGLVHSPFLGVIKAGEFYAKLDNASAQSILTVLDVLVGETTAAARFRYDWTLHGGDKILFEGVDHFTFDDQDLFTDMRIYYDTHPARQEVGDKYA
ncbi:nuclear transport factor 2 family protein [Aliisedimentitalea scapharcae]|uniref:Nuclear transport factor 2 family protein n=1 Tax=Aliisedimentitalea scapharcae TaxID=1524259 RepID=A0ABZ2XSQ2_9RHOB